MTLIRLGPGEGWCNGGEPGSGGQGGSEDPAPGWILPDVRLPAAPNRVRRLPVRGGRVPPAGNLFPRSKLNASSQKPVYSFTPSGGNGGY